MRVSASETQAQARVKLWMLQPIAFRVGGWDGNPLPPTHISPYFNRRGVEGGGTAEGQRWGTSLDQYNLSSLSLQAKFSPPRVHAMRSCASAVFGVSVLSVLWIKARAPPPRGVEETTR